MSYTGGMRNFSFVCFLLSCAALFGCNSSSDPVDGEVDDPVLVEAKAAPPSQPLRLAVVAAPDANDGASTQLDVVFVYDVAGTPLPTSSPAWFAQRERLRQAFSRALDVVPLELAPGDRIEDVQLPERHHEAECVVVFSNLLASPEVVQLTGLGPVQLRVTRATVQVFQR